MPSDVITKNNQKNYLVPLIIMAALFFIFGFVTWANSTLIPYLQLACELKTSEAVLVTFAFYISYAVMAFPSSWVLKKVGFKKGMVLGLFVMAIGALIFIPAANARSFQLFLVGLFIIGTGLALLQTASNPYITILGPIESAAKRISIMGVCNKLAGALAPLILGFIVLQDSGKIESTIASLSGVEKSAYLDDLASKVIAPYVGIAIVLVILAFLINLSSLPEIKAEGEEIAENEVDTNRSSIFSYPYLWLGFITIFMYVGVEVMAGDIIQIYGKEIGIPLEEAKHFTTYTMIGMLAGYIIGIITIPKILSQTKALVISAVLGLIFSVAAIYTSGITSILFIALLGFANALIWPAVWPLTIEGLGKFTKTGSALLIVGIAGGAIIPKIWATIGEKIGMQPAFWIMVPCYAFILFFALKGHKMGKAVKAA